MAVERYHPPEVTTAAHSDAIEIASTGGMTVLGLVGFFGAAMTILGAGTQTAFLLIGGLVVLGIAAVGTWIMRREATTWHDAEIYFDSWPLTLGSTTRVTVVRASKKPLPDAPNIELPARLKCTETAIWRQGTDTRRENQTVVDVRIPIPGHVQTNTFVGSVDLVIPVEAGAPTLDLKHNKINWELDIELDALSTLSFHKDIALTVIPELDRDLVRFVDAPPPPRPQDA